MSSSSFILILVIKSCNFVIYHIIIHILSINLNCEFHVIDVDTSHNHVNDVIYHVCNISFIIIVFVIMHIARLIIIFHIVSSDFMIIVSFKFEMIIVNETRNLLMTAKKMRMTKILIYIFIFFVIHDNLINLVNVNKTLLILQSFFQKCVYTLTKVTAKKEILVINCTENNVFMLIIFLRLALCFNERDRHFLAKMLTVTQMK